MSKKNESIPTTAETITPLSLPSSKRSGTGTVSSAWLQRLLFASILCGLALLVFGGGSLLYYLSRNPLYREEAAGTQQSITDDTPKPSGKPVPVMAPNRPVIEKDPAHRKMAEFLAARNRLAAKGVADWGEPSYIEMTAASQAADQAMLSNDYTTAADQYARAVAIAQELESRSHSVLTEMLDAGQAALAAGDGLRAQQKFTTALRIDATNRAAKRGLRRAATIDAVTALLDSGKKNEDQGNLDLAVADYQQALQMDAESPEAKEALNRAAGKRSRAVYRQRMTEGMAAFHKEEYSLAREKLQEARALQPDSREVQEALSAVDQADRRARVDKLLTNAQAAERSEDWPRALAAYNAVLAIDESIQFARKGSRRSTKQIQFARRFDLFLNNPESLESDEQLEQAVLLLREAGAAEPKGSDLAERIQKLEQLVRVAQTPIKVVVESDRLTQVAIYKIGKLGKFAVHELALRPGTYTVVGSRDGYRDIRRKIVVKAGQEIVRVAVICKDQI